MGALGLQDVTKSTTADAVSLDTLAELTGFPADYIKRELLLEGECVEEMTLEEFRKKVLAYLDSNF
ncbi:MAG: hypothetical protein WC635_13405 [Bacteriovorax sp.]|jgi:hypothetical protein